MKNWSYTITYHKLCSIVRRSPISLFPFKPHIQYLSKFEQFVQSLRQINLTYEATLLLLFWNSPSTLLQTLPFLLNRIRFSQKKDEFTQNKI